MTKIGPIFYHVPYSHQIKCTLKVPSCEVGINNINLTRGLFTGRWIQPSLGEEEKITSKILSTFGLFNSKPCSQINIVVAGLSQNRHNFKQTMGFYENLRNSHGSSWSHCQNPSKFHQLALSLNKGIVSFQVDWNQSSELSPS